MCIKYLFTYLHITVNNTFIDFFNCICLSIINWIIKTSNTYLFFLDKLFESKKDWTPQQWFLWICKIFNQIMELQNCLPSMKNGK